MTLESRLEALYTRDIAERTATRETLLNTLDNATRLHGQDKDTVASCRAEHEVQSNDELREQLYYVTCIMPLL